MWDKNGKGLLHSAVYAPQRWAGQPEILDVYKRQGAG